MNNHLGNFCISLSWCNKDNHLGVKVDGEMKAHLQYK